MPKIGKADRSNCSGKQMRDRLQAIGLSVNAFARHLDEDERQLRRWIAGMLCIPLGTEQELRHLETKPELLQRVLAEDAKWRSFRRPR